MFALRRIPEGGCILADEVVPTRLGKTIEAGLVIAQLLAEGATRVLIIVPRPPRPLLGQWQSELYTLFGIEAIEADTAPNVEGAGVFIAGREYAGGNRGFAHLSTTPPFDLCLIDEAHEVFAGIYRRFDRYGAYEEDSRHANTAHRVRKVIGASPVLLLTATPIQNSLAELWGLVQYVDPTGTLLGSRSTFEELFCEDSNGRSVVSEQAVELRRRLSSVVQRTLRRQAQEFLDRPFVGRRAQLFEYGMSPEERALYDDVTDYLLRPQLCAFRGRSRQLLLLGFHRRMASSTAALARSLERIAVRLRRMLQGGRESVDDEAGKAFLRDLEEEGEPEQNEDSQPERPEVPDDRSSPDPSTIQAEIDLVETFVRRARSLPHDSKAESLIRAVRLVTSRDEDRQKVVIFTESLTTQDYLRKLLVEQARLQDEDITLFRGTNESPRDMQALSQWRDEVEREIAPHMRPSSDIAVRLALVHEFRTRTKVMISSEAGAKGLNLQFCDTLINYDLPWNPQRIEQRIGRCHRYGQRRDVTVINFLAKDNEAQRLTFEILSTKLDLFGQVLDSSDVVLQTPRSDSSASLASALGPNFESELRRIWDRARSVQEVEEELRQLRDTMEDRRMELERVRERTIGMIETGFDDSVKDVFRNIQSELPSTLAELDQDLERVLTGYLEAVEVSWGVADRDGNRIVHVGASAQLPSTMVDGGSVTLGPAQDLTDIESLHLSHPLIEASVAEARESGGGTFRVRFLLDDDAPEVLRHRLGGRGRLALTKVMNRGFEREDRLIVTVVFESEEVLRPAEAATELLKQRCEDVDEIIPPVTISPIHLDEVVTEEIFIDQSAAGDAEQETFSKAMDQLDQYVADRALVLKRTRNELHRRLIEAEQRRDGALGPDRREREEIQVNSIERSLDALDSQIEALESRQDVDYERWKTHAHTRRYAPPQIERLLQAEFCIE